MAFPNWNWTIPTAQTQTEPATRFPCQQNRVGSGNHINPYFNPYFYPYLRQELNTSEIHRNRIHSVGSASTGWHSWMQQSRHVTFNNSNDKEINEWIDVNDLKIPSDISLTAVSTQRGKNQIALKNKKMINTKERGKNVEDRRDVNVEEEAESNEGKMEENEDQDVSTKVKGKVELTDKQLEKTKLQNQSCEDEEYSVSKGKVEVLENWLREQVAQFEEREKGVFENELADETVREEVSETQLSSHQKDWAEINVKEEMETEEVEQKENKSLKSSKETEDREEESREAPLKSVKRTEELEENRNDEIRRNENSKSTKLETHQIRTIMDEDQKGPILENEKQKTGAQQSAASQLDSFSEYPNKNSDSEAHWADLNVKEEIEIEKHKVEQKGEILLESTEEAEEQKEETPPESCKETEEIERRKEETPPEPCKETEERKEETPPESSKEAESGDKFKCKRCSYKTNWKGNMTKHVISRHQSSEEIKWYECAHCSYKSKTKENLRTHLRLSHDQFVTWYNCTKCPYRCKTKQFLQSHILSIHTAPEDVKWFKCEQCDFKSKFKKGLKEHKLNKHTDENEIKWFRCDSCKYKAKRKKELKMHVINKHTKHDLIKWFKCEKCEFRGKLSRLLRKHMLKCHGETEKARVEG